MYLFMLFFVFSGGFETQGFLDYLKRLWQKIESVGIVQDFLIESVRIVQASLFETGYLMKVLYMWLCVYLFVCFCLFIVRTVVLKIHMIDDFYSSLQYTSDAKCSCVMFVLFIFSLIMVGSNVNSFLSFYFFFFRFRLILVCAF